MEELPVIDQYNDDSFKKLSINDLEENNDNSCNNLVLPEIKANNTGEYSKAMKITNQIKGKKEASIIVGTTNNTISNNNQLTEEWMNQTVNTVAVNKEYQKTKLQWENQIAKHILAMFATTNAVKDYNEGAALLDFVETSKFNTTTTTTTENVDNTIDKNNIIIEETDNDLDNTDNEIINKISKKKIKKKTSY